METLLQDKNKLIIFVQNSNYEVYQPKYFLLDDLDGKYSLFRYYSVDLFEQS